MNQRAKIISALTCAIAAGWLFAACFPFDFDQLRDDACDAGPRAPSDCGGPVTSDAGGSDASVDAGNDGGGNPIDSGEMIDAGADEDAGADAGMDAGMQATCPSGAGDAGEILDEVYLVRPSEQHTAGAARIGLCTFEGGVRESVTTVGSVGRLLTFNAAGGQPYFTLASDGGFYFARDLTAAGTTPILSGSYSADTDNYAKITQGTTAAVFGLGTTPWELAITVQGSSSWADARTISSHPVGTPGAYVIAGSYEGTPTIGPTALDADAGVRGFVAWLPTNGGAPTRLATLGCPNEPTQDIRIDRVEATPLGGALISGLYREANGCTLDLGNGNQPPMSATSGGYVAFAAYFEPTQMTQWLVTGGYADSSAPAIVTRAPDGTAWLVFTTITRSPELLHIEENGSAAGIFDPPSDKTVAQDLKVLPSGDLLIAGFATGSAVRFGSIPVAVLNPPDAFLTRLHPDGSEVGTWVYGGTGQQQIDRIVLTANSGVFLFGEGLGASDFAPESATSGDTDVFILRVAQ